MDSPTPFTINQGASDGFELLWVNDDPQSGFVSGRVIYLYRNYGPYRLLLIQVAEDVSNLDMITESYVIVNDAGLETIENIDVANDEYALSLAELLPEGEKMVQERAFHYAQVIRSLSGYMRLAYTHNDGITIYESDAGNAGSFIGTKDTVIPIRIYGIR